MQNSGLVSRLCAQNILWNYKFEYFEYNINMQQLSVALATYYEEENLEKCLNSVKDLANEIVIVDGGSKDRTVEIAKKYTDKLIVTDNPSVFHINKQKAIDKCTKDWILQLDADEVVSEELKKEIMERVLKKEEKTTNGFWISRKNWFLGRFLIKGGQYPDYTLRLYRRGKGKLPQKSVHEQAVVEGNVEYLKSPLLHYPYKNFSVYLEKWNRYNGLFSSDLISELENKNKIIILFYGLGYFVIKPLYWFTSTYIRHKGFLDGWQGFVFCFFSSLRFPVSYVKYLRRN